MGGNNNERAAKMFIFKWSCVKKYNVRQKCEFANGPAEKLYIHKSSCSNKM